MSSKIKLFTLYMVCAALILTIMEVANFTYRQQIVLVFCEMITLLMALAQLTSPNFEKKPVKRLPSSVMFRGVTFDIIDGGKCPECAFFTSCNLYNDIDRATNFQNATGVNCYTDECSFKVHSEN